MIIILIIASIVSAIIEVMQGSDDFLDSIIIIAIVIVIDIGFFAMRISIEHEYNKYDYSSSSSQEMSASDFAENAINVYEIGHLAQFSDERNHLAEIKSGFTSYLKNELELSDVTVNGNKITCKFNYDTIIFTVTKNDIKYSVK